MSTATVSIPMAAPLPMPAVSIAPTPYRFTVKEFHKMIDANIFGDKRIELIEGLVYHNMSVNPAHDGSLDNVEELIRALLPSGWILRNQKAVALSASQPLPDAVVAVGNRRTFLATHPVPAQIGLLVEVSDSTLASDRAVKGPMYARENIEQYWIVNIPERQVEVYTQPSGPTATPEYGHCQVYRSGDAVPLVLRGVALGTIAVDELLP